MSLSLRMRYGKHLNASLWIVTYAVLLGILPIRPAWCGYAAPASSRGRGGAHAMEEVGLGEEGAEADAGVVAERREGPARVAAVVGDELERGLESGHAVAGGDGRVHGDEACLQRAGGVEVARRVERDELQARGGGDIGERGDGASGTDDKRGQEEPGAAGEDGEAFAGAGGHLGQLGNVAGAILGAGDVGVRGEGDEGLGVEVHAGGIGGHVVDDDGDGTGIRHGAVVGAQGEAGHLGAVVVRREDEGGVGARLGGEAASGDGGARGVGASAREHLAVRAGGLAHRGDDLPALVVVEVDILAVGAERDEASDAALAQAADVLPLGIEVERFVRGEEGGQRRVDAREGEATHGCASLPLLPPAIAALRRREDREPDGAPAGWAGAGPVTSSSTSSGRTPGTSPPTWRPVLPFLPVFAAPACGRETMAGSLPMRSRKRTAWRIRW